MKCNCFECPLGKKSYEHYMRICEELNEEPYFEEVIYDIWCDKTGYKCGWYGHCDEAFEEDIKQIYQPHKKQSSKYTRREQHNTRVSNIYSFTKRRWMSPYYEHDGRLILSNFSWRTKRFYKKYSNKQVRKYRMYITNGSCYRKIYNYKWTIS